MGVSGAVSGILPSRRACMRNVTEYTTSNFRIGATESVNLAVDSSAFQFINIRNARKVSSNTGQNSCIIKFSLSAELHARIDAAAEVRDCCCHSHW